MALTWCTVGYSVKHAEGQDFKIMERKTKKQLLYDVVKMWKLVVEKKYIMTPNDLFALGYLCGKYDVKKLFDNQDEVIEACRKYDETDDLELLDTIGETLIDLGIINNDKNII